MQIERTPTDKVAEVRPEQIPKTLIRYWHDLKEIPADVRQCLDSWNALAEEGVSIRTFGDESARDYIREFFSHREVAAFDVCRHPAMRSDYFRMCFLLTEGGLYVDADDVLLGDGWRTAYYGETLKVQPLCYDVRLSAMASAAKIRRRDLPTEDKIFYVNNNPIAAPIKHPVLQRALSRATDVLLGKDPTPEIQSTTGPGNLTLSLATHAAALLDYGLAADYELLLGWDFAAEPRWELDYRNDERNWRNMTVADGL